MSDVYPQEEWLGLYPYAPGGFVSQEDEQAEQLALVNPHIPIETWSRELAFHEIGDEYFGGSSYCYIPTETQVKSMIALVNVNTAMEGPTQFNEPSVNSLVQSLYQSASQLWQEMRRAGGTGW